MAGAQRDFGSVLDDLFVEAIPDEPAEISSPPSLDYLSVADELHSGRITVSQETAESLYLDTAAWLEVEAEILIEHGQPSLSSLPSVDPADISRELGLADAVSPEDFDRLRRAFAFANHPDRVAPELRPWAIIRMQEANRLIDEAKKAAA